VNKKLLLISCALISASLYTIDNPHFYRANFFWGEPRFEKPWLTTLDFNIAGGQTKTGRNSEGEKTPILNIYGPQNMQALGNTPGLNPANPLDAILINLAALPSANCFAHLEFTGKFDLLEGTFQFYQNFCNGFFAQLYLPFRHLKLKKTNNFIDLSPETGALSQTTPEWTAFLNNFDAILAQFGLSKQPVEELGLGDFTMLFGWTINYQEFNYIDFLDVTAKVGVLFPTAQQKNQREAFSIPLGYNGHYGIPLKFDISFGYWEWLTAGFHIGALFLLEKTVDMRMMSVPGQANCFMLLEGQAEMDPGTIWEVATFIKADHIWRGLSILFGHTYTQKDDDCIELKQCENFDQAVVQSNPRLKGWDMQVLHFNLEWDFTKTARDFGPRVGVFYNYVAGGKRIYNTAMKDGYMGFDIAWCF
jgi:hypothetical protein